MAAKNYALTVLNLFASGLFLITTFDPAVFLCFLGASLLCMLCTSWNAVGELLVIWFVFRARRIPRGALIAPAVSEYLNLDTTKKYLSEKKGCVVYYAKSEVTYYIPISRHRAVISLALEDSLLKQGAGVLSRGVLPGAYAPDILFSKRLLLLSLLGLSIMLAVMRVWTWFSIFVIEALFVCAMLMVTWSFIKALSYGRLLGLLAAKLVGLINLLQDKIVEWFMVKTQAYCFNYVERSGEIGR